MKKLLMVAVATMMAISAHAVTLTWKDVSDAAVGDNKITSSATIEGIGGADFSVKVVIGGMAIKTDSPVYWNYMVSLSPNATEYGPQAVGVRLAGTGNGYTEGYYYLAYGSALPNNMELKSDNDAISFSATKEQTFLFEYDASEKSLLVAVDGTILGTVSGLTFDDDVYLSIGTQLGTDGNNGMATTLNSWNVKSAEYAILPEPTCLALLALGVAGIALKRKVA